MSPSYMEALVKTEMMGGYGVPESKIEHHQTQPHSGVPTTRKRRRGVIEKRRRDRINCSLTDLRKLVPACYEKQGSAKLEKAEILQMTVEHLKMIGTKTHTSIAMDYRSLGFRECASEVARYLVTIEGMDVQDPLRLRLMSHLQCYMAQREAAMAAQRHPAAPWGTATYQPPAQTPFMTPPNGGIPNGIPTNFMPVSHAGLAPTGTGDVTMNGSPSCTLSEPRPTLAAAMEPCGNPSRYMGHPPIGPAAIQNGVSSNSSLSSIGNIHPSQIPANYSQSNILSGGGGQPTGYPPGINNLGKPYRPWGSEGFPIGY